MLKKNTKYIPSRIPEKESNNINDDNNDNSNMEHCLVQIVSLKK